MLVLSRKSQESVVVGSSDGFERLLKVTVLEIRGERVRLGFEIDKEVPGHRWEVWERIRISGRPDSPTAAPAAPSAESPHGMEMVITGPVGNSPTEPSLFSRRT